MSAKALKARRREASVFDKAVGERLRARRLNAFLSLEDVADKTGFSLSQISRFERGECTCEASTLAKLARVFRCKVSDLIDGIEVQ